MAVTESYKAILKVQRWRDTPILSAADASALSNDMEAVYQALINQSDLIRRLKITEVALRTDRRPPMRVKKAREYETPDDPLRAMATPVERRSLVASL